MWTLFLSLALADPVEISGEEAVAAAVQNVAFAKTLRVRWQTTNESTAERREFYESAIRVCERRSTQADLPEEARARAKAAVEKHRLGLKISQMQPLTEAWDFWTDRRNYQIRETAGTVDERKLTKLLPDCEATPDKLKSDFKTTAVTSWGEVTEGKFRYWTGRSNDNVHFRAAIDLNFPSVDGYLPPLAAPRLAPPNIASVYDLFFVHPAETEEEGWTKLRGEDVLTVSRRFEDSKEFANYRPGRSIRVRAFLSPTQNFLPLRLEIYQGSGTSEKSTSPDPCDNAGCRFDRLVRDIKLVEIVPGFFYPVSGIVEQFRMAASDSDIPELRVTPHYRTTWIADKIEVNREMSKANFELKFPENTIFANYPTGDIMVMGDREEFAKRVVTQANPGPPGGTSPWTILLWVAGAAAIAGGLWKMRKRTG